MVKKANQWRNWGWIQNMKNKDKVFRTKDKAKFVLFSACKKAYFQLKKRHRWWHIFMQDKKSILLDDYEKRALSRLICQYN